MERFGTETRLKENQVYTATLRVKGEELTISFTSRYSPLFSTARIIKSDFKKLFGEYETDHINRLIYENSRLAMEISQVPVDLEDVSHDVKQYVRYKTEYDLATDLYLNLIAESGQQDRQLGDLRIVNQKQAFQVKAAMDLLEKRVNAWESRLLGSDNIVGSATRAGANEYPIGTRLSF